MTDNSRSYVRPFLVGYEVDIPEDSGTCARVYDERRMILMVNGRPAALEPYAYLHGGTKMTAVEHETTDDD
jgi:hypothetical protein